MPRFDGRWFPSSKTSDWAAGKFGTPGWYPAAPTGVTPTEGDQQIALSWDAGNTHGSDITGYKVEKNDGSWSTVTSDTGSDATSYTATGLTNGTAYTFRVTAINGVGEGESPSSVSASKTARGVPGTPGTLSLAEGSPAHTVIDLSWSAPGSANGAAITGYKIQRSTDGSSWSNIVADTESTGTTYSNTGLTGSTAYHYRVAAINVAGAGGYGNEPTRTTADPVMTYTTTGSPTLRTSGIYSSLTWTGSGSFVVTANPNSLTGNILIIAGGGGAGTGNSNTKGSGGGGAGGMQELTGQALGVATHTVTIGSGGTGPSNASGASGGNGGNSSFGSLTASVGGGGGSGAGVSGAAAGGGSGGGGSSYNDNNNNSYVGGNGTSGQGEEGGNGNNIYGMYHGAGGGGKGYRGGYSASYTWAGGIGKANDWSTGSDIDYAGGGGSSGYYYLGGWSNWMRGGSQLTGSTEAGAPWNTTTVGQSNASYGAGNGQSNPWNGGGDGGANTGGGGAPNAYNGIANGSFGGAGAGGSGVVVLRWVTE